MDKTKKENKPAEIFGKGFFFSLALFLGIGFVSRWFSAASAAALVTLCLGMLAYWIPPRPAVTFGSWVVKVIQWTILVLLVGLLYSYFGA